jgi:hypothetical protein
MRDFNEFQDYRGFVYFDDEGLVRSSHDDEIIGVPVGYRDEGDRITVQIQTGTDEPPLTWWQRLKRWMGWTK